MNKIIITIFAILFVPFVGLPVVYDRVVYAVLGIFLAYFVLMLLRKIRKKDGDTDIIAPTKDVEKKVLRKKKRERTPLISAEEKDSIKEAVAKSKK